MDKVELLNNLYFGSVDSETDDNLDKNFIQTEDFDLFVDPKTSVIIGAKGSGKSALYRYFTDFETSARKVSKQDLSKTYITSGTGFKDVPNMDYSAIFTEMKEGKINFQSAWNLYIMYRLVYQLYEKNNIIAGEYSKKLLIKQHILKDTRLFAKIISLFEKYVGDLPEINNLSFADISIQISKNKKIMALDVLSEINKYLTENEKTVWILLDKIDELFSDMYDIRKKCLEGLFLTLIDFQSRFHNIKLKIFVRSDIWSELSFINKSHLTDKKVSIRWNKYDLKYLIMKRASLNKKIMQFITDQTGIKKITENIDHCFYSLFPLTVYPGSREAETIDFMIDRITDGQNGIYPREIINFCNESITIEKNKLTSNITDREYPPLISGLAIREAFLIVSKNKVETYLSEFEHLKEHFNRFEGQTQAEYSNLELITLMSGLSPSGNEMIRQLYETGVIKGNLTSIVNSTTYTIPRLFRPGLKIILKGRP